MRNGVLRAFYKAIAVLGLMTLSSGAFAHGLIQDPPSRNWFCGAVTKPDHVANGTAQYPVCGQAFNAPGVSSNDGYSFMSVLTHTTGRLGVGPRANVCGFNSETWNGRATVWDQPINWPTVAMTAGATYLHLEHLLGSALLGHGRFPLLDHEVRFRVDGRQGAVLQRF